MSQDKNKQLVVRLLDRTRRSKIDWKDAVEGGFQVSLSNNTIKLQKSQGRNGIVYTVSLFNAVGELADAFTDEELDADENTGVWFEALREMHGLAQRYARGADKILNEILSELDDDIPF